MVAFSFKGRDLCPSCATRRMVEVSAHLVDQVLPRVQHRQWVLSVPRRVRWHLRYQPAVISGLLAVFLRAVETTIRQRSPGAPSDARFGAVAFVHRFGSYLNSHVHFHVLVSDGVFSADTDGAAIFHPALDLTRADFVAVQSQMRRRGLRWLERLARYCTRPPLSQERLGRLNDQLLVYNLQRATADGRTELLLTPAELLDRLAQLVTPPRIHKHRTCGVLAPNARLRRAVTASAGPAGATLQLLQQARAEMGLPSADAPALPLNKAAADEPKTGLRPAAARCWALLLARIYACLPLRCPKCGKPMRIIAFVLEQPVIERILAHLGEPTRPPAVRPARPPPQGEFPFDQTLGPDDWPEMDQTAGLVDGWE
jgi:hypothetical protein